MPGTDESKLHARETARRDWSYAGHVLLCGNMIAWRMIDSTPGVSPAENGAFAASTAGLVLTTIAVWLGVASFVGVIALTLLTRRDAKLWLLLGSMSLSMIWRREIDVFDITYVALVAILSAWWFSAGRARMQSSHLSARPGP